MERSRGKPRSGLATLVLMRNKHRCCVCQQEQVILHHIDGNHENDVASNLAVLCLHHHGLAHARLKLGQNYTPAVIRAYKAVWETRVRKGVGLPAALVDTTAVSLARVYERQQTALRIVMAEELESNYRVVLYRYSQAGGTTADLSVRMVVGLPELRMSRWRSMSDVGHLQEYVEVLSRTYAAIELYNFEVARSDKQGIPAQEWARLNLRVGSAISMSLGPLLVSLGSDPVDVARDFGDDRFLAEFAQGVGG